MDQPSTNNVYPLKPGAQAQDMLQVTRSLALQVLPPILAGVLARADDALFDLVQKSYSTFEQQQFFDAMRELRRQRIPVGMGACARERHLRALLRVG